MKGTKDKKVSFRVTYDMWDWLEYIAKAKKTTPSKLMQTATIEIVNRWYIKYGDKI